MYKYLKIVDIRGREVLDSRGNPTVEAQVTVKADGKAGELFTAIADVPSGASTGKFEAMELRDGDKRYNGAGVSQAVENINKEIYPALEGMNGLNQRKIDSTMIAIDGTENKKKLGANAILAVSMANMKACAKALKLPEYQYVGGICGEKMPIPMMNILNGGKHSDNNISMQEFMIIPVGTKSFAKRLQIGTEVYHNLKKILKESGHVISVGDEGGFAPNLENEEEAIESIIKAIEKAGYKPGVDVCLALDVASTEMYDEAKKEGKDGYLFWKTGEYKTKEEMIDYLCMLVEKYPIISIEDGLAEEDWEAWKILTEKIGDKCQLVGDDLFVTNVERLEKGITNKIANAILIKFNQIGTLTETLDAIKMAQKYGYKTIISHRSGETEDTTIADLAVAVNAGQIKTGAPCRTDRVAKYNRLLNIEEEI